MNPGRTQATTYWEEAFQITSADLEHLYNLLIEDETPLTSGELARALVERRIKAETERQKREQARDARPYRPAEAYESGERLVFPALQYMTGTVAAVRPGDNPEYGDFTVLQVAFADGRFREFASGLARHALNNVPEPVGEGVAEQTPDEVLAQYGDRITALLNARLAQARDLVRIAGRWFPRALLLEISAGNRNLAEAVLDVSGGGPLPASALRPHLQLPDNVNPRLLDFSLNYALQEDQRFDEVGPAGEILWYLRRLEPPEVLYPPPRLGYNPEPYDRGILSPELLKLEMALDDEYAESTLPAGAVDEVLVTLTFPHLRVGTLPLSPRLAALFPTAYEAPRIRFILVDAHTGAQFPGWVEREQRYVFGLDEWYKQNNMVVGGYVTVRRGKQSGQVEVRAHTRRPTSEWVRTAAPADGRRLTFSMTRQPIAVEYDEQMSLIVGDYAQIDDLWLRTRERNVPLPSVVAGVFRELARLNPQSAVHARSLYSAVNVVRRTPPGPIFAELLSRPYFAYVGDLYWRFDESRWSA